RSSDLEPDGPASLLLFDESPSSPPQPERPSKATKVKPSLLFNLRMSTAPWPTHRRPPLPSGAALVRCTAAVRPDASDAPQPRGAANMSCVGQLAAHAVGLLATGSFSGQPSQARWPSGSMTFVPGYSGGGRVGLAPTSLGTA